MAMGELNYEYSSAAAAAAMQVGATGMAREKEDSKVGFLGEDHGVFFIMSRRHGATVQPCATPASDDLMPHSRQTHLTPLRGPSRRVALL